MPSTVEPSHPLYDAHWIWPAPLREVEGLAVAQFRRDFDLPTRASALPKFAPLHLSADARYCLWVNGEFAHAGPARGFQVAWPFDTLDIARHLQTGRNWISVRVYTPGRSTEGYRHENAAGLIVAGDFGSAKVLTPDHWWCRFEPRAARFAEAREVVDLRRDDGAWIDDEYFVPAPDEGWSHVGEALAPDSPPWHRFEPRGLPTLDGQDRVVTLDTVEGGTFDFDLDRLETGLLRLRAKSTRIGQSFKLTDTAGNALALVVADGQPIDWIGQHRLRTRRLLLTTDGPADGVEVGIRQLRYPLEVVGGFETDSPELNAAYDEAVNAVESRLTDGHELSLSHHELSPSHSVRELFLASSHLASDSRLLRRELRQTSRQSLPNGLLYAQAPSTNHAAVMPDLCLNWCLSHFDHFWQTGSPELYEQHRGTLYRLLDYFALVARDKDSGLLRCESAYKLSMEKQGVCASADVSALLNLRYAEVLGKLSVVADEAGLSEADELRTASEVHAAKCVAAFFDETEQVLCDGLDARGERLADASPVVQVMRLMLRLPGADVNDIVARHVQPALESGLRLPGEWMTMLYDAAREAGRAEVALEHLLSTSDEDSTLAAVHLPRLLAGIRQVEPGWECVEVRPLLSWPGVTRCEAAVPTPGGVLRVVWQRDEDGRVHLEADVPTGTSVEPRGIEKDELVGAGLHGWTVPA